MGNCSRRSIILVQHTFDCFCAFNTILRYLFTFVPVIQVAEPILAATFLIFLYFDMAIRANIVFDQFWFIIILFAFWTMVPLARHRKLDCHR